MHQQKNYYESPEVLLRSTASMSLRKRGRVKQKQHLVRTFNGMSLEHKVGLRVPAALCVRPPLPAPPPPHASHIFALNQKVSQNSGAVRMNKTSGWAAQMMHFLDE